MRPRFSHVLVAALSLGIATAAVSSHATESIDLSLSGEIRPSACTILLTPGTLDYGTIPASSLGSDTPTPLPQMPFQVAISCTGPTLTALSFGDNRAGTEGDASMSAETWFGLGEVRDKPVGAFQIVRTDGSVVANGTAVQTIEFTRSGSWLQMNPDYPEVSARNGYLLSWSPAGTVPTAFENVLVPLAVRPTLIGRQAMAPLSDRIPMDGLATISLIYL